MSKVHSKRGPFYKEIKFVCYNFKCVNINIIVFE